tara:strand:- start:3567 stop:3989 length:423 start_codon:yes stop_codon:yes gene_type:complete
MFKKNNGRTTYKSGRRPTYKKTSGFQSYKNRNKGNVSQQYNKYLKLAKEAFRSGDRVQSEYYYQFTDHFYRLMVELGINIDDNAQLEENKQSASTEQVSDNDNQTSNEDDTIKSDESEESIESIPFIAQPTREKRTRSSK